MPRLSRLTATQLASVLALTTLAFLVGCGSNQTSGSIDDMQAPAESLAVVIRLGDQEAVGLVARRGDDWQVTRRIVLGRGARAIAWSPTGEELAITTRGGNLANELVLVALHTGRQRLLARAAHGVASAFFGGLAWSPDGKYIAVTKSIGLYDGEIALIAVATGRTLRTLRVAARLDSGLSWAPDGNRIYFARQTSPRAPATLYQADLKSWRVSPVASARGLDPSTRRTGVVIFTAPRGIALTRAGVQETIAGTRPGDRFASWSGSGRFYVVERPLGQNCPRLSRPPLCSRVLILPPRGDSHYLPMLARNPAPR